MKTRVGFWIGFSLLLSPLHSSRAEEGAIVVKDLPSKDASSLTIEKGNHPQWTEFQIVDGKDDIYGSPEFDRAKAYASWKTACAEWKQSMKEMNSERQILTLNCMSPQLTSDAGYITYKSSGTYKMRVKMRERK